MQIYEKIANGSINRQRFYHFLAFLELTTNSVCGWWMFLLSMKHRKSDGLLYLLQEIYGFVFLLELALDDCAIIVGNDDFDVFETVVGRDVVVTIDVVYGFLHVCNLSTFAVQGKDTDGFDFAFVRVW